VVVMKGSILCDTLSCGLLKVNELLEEYVTSSSNIVTYLKLVSCLAYCSTLKMEMACSYET
jgi:hypothetical protein